MVSEQNVDAGAEALKNAELALRAAVAEHGPTHAVVLQRLETFIGLCRQFGKAEQAAKLEEKAVAIRAILAKQAPAAPPAPLAEEPVKQPEPTIQAEDEEEPELEVIMPARAQLASPAPTAVALTDSTAEKHLYNSRGEHVAVFFDDALFTPVGKFLARWEPDLDAFIDDKGWYFGQIIMDNRLAYDPIWHWRHMNFGTKATAGSRIGWARQPDTDRTMLLDGYNDVSFAEEESE